MTITLRSFNPCSYGSSVLTEFGKEKGTEIIVKFQSLFLWIFRSYTLLSESIYGIWLLVSLLVLMDLSFLQKEFIEDGGYIFKFQSLFLWIFRSYSNSDYRVYSDPMHVSILVLMDLSFLHDFRRKRKC